jgi:hypothetical protein
MTAALLLIAVRETRPQKGDELYGSEYADDLGEKAVYPGHLASS